MCHLIPANCNNADILIHLDRCCWSVLTECSWPLQYLGPHSAALCTMKLIFLVAVLPQFPVQFSCWVPFPSTCLRIFVQLGQFHVWVKWMCLCMCIYVYIYVCVCEAVWTWTWLSKVILQLNTRSWALKFLAALQHVLVVLAKEGVVWAIWQGTRVVAFGNSFEGCSTPFHSPISEASRQNRQFCSHDPDPFPSLAHFTNSNRNHVLSGQVWSLLQCDPVLLRAGYLSISCKGCRWQV